MYYSVTKNGKRIDAATYAIEVREDAISVILAGEQVALLKPSSAVNTLVGGDVKEDTVSDALTLIESRDGDAYVFTWTGKSAWLG